MEESVRLVESKSHSTHHLSKSEYKELLRLFNVYRREKDPLQGPAKKCLMVPVKLAATLAMARGHKQLLLTLGQPIPAEWIRLEEHTQLALEGGVDLALQEQVEEDEELMEAMHVALQDELLAYDEEAIPESDEQKFEGRSYALREHSKELKSQLASFREYRTAILNSARQGKRVMEVTVNGNIACLLRFLGFAARQPSVTGNPDMRIFKQDGCRVLLDEYAGWLVADRKIAYGRRVPWWDVVACD